MPKFFEARKNNHKCRTSLETSSPLGESKINSLSLSPSLPPEASPLPSKFFTLTNQTGSLYDSHFSVFNNNSPYIIYKLCLQHTQTVSRRTSIVQDVAAHIKGQHPVRKSHSPVCPPPDKSRKLTENWLIAFIIPVFEDVLS